MVGGSDIIYGILSNDANVVADVTKSNGNKKIHKDFVPQDTTLPFIVYFSIDATPINNIEGFAGVIRERIQIDCYADNPRGCRELGKKVFDAVADHPRAKVLGHELQGIDFLSWNATVVPDQDADEKPISRHSADYMVTYDL